MPLERDYQKSLPFWEGADRVKGFRKNHLIEILNQSEESTLPLDTFLRLYLRRNPAIGSKDRQEICETLYGMVRWRALLDYLCPRPVNWERKLELFCSINPLDFKNKSEIPLNIRLSFPKFIFDTLSKAYGTQKAIKFCLGSNTSAPTTIRVNTAKITREELLNQWKNLYAVSPCEHSPWGIIFHKKINLLALPEFKSGLFEIQDEGSQLVAHQVAAKPGNHVMDYCAGSGGKTLAFAHKLQNRGQIHMYDIREFMLLEAKKRLKRAGVQIFHMLTRRHLKKKSLLKKMDWILLDVPCSGSGRLRRSPDMKWKIEKGMLDQLARLQRHIFSCSLKFLRDSGRIVYATCSVFPEENEKQVSHFIKKHNLKLVEPPFVSFPASGKMDGFFSAVLSY